MAFIKDYTDIDFLSDLNEILSEKPTSSQRDIGDDVGASVSIVNALIKRCLERGWVAVSRIDGRKLRYMLTAEGFKALTKRSISFMKRNFTQLSNYKKNIDNHIEQAKYAGKTKVVLYGTSDVSFLLEESCKAHDMEFEIKDTSEIPEIVAENEFAVVGESVQEEVYEVGQNGQLATVFGLARGF